MKPVRSIIWSLVRVSNVFPSILRLLKLSQYVAQSLTRRNCATSKTFHSDGTRSPDSELFCIPSASLGIYLLLAEVTYKNQINQNFILFMVILSDMVHLYLRLHLYTKIMLTLMYDVAVLSLGGGGLCTSLCVSLNAWP